MRKISVALSAAITMYAIGSVEPARATPPIADFGKLPAVEQMQLSPTGENIAYIAVVGDSRRVVIKKTGGGDVFAIDVGELKLRRLEWLDAKHVLVETSKTIDMAANVEKNIQQEIYQSTLLDATTGKARNVFEGQTKILHATYGYYGHTTEKGQSFGYFGGLTLTGGGDSFHDFSTRNGYITHGHTDLYKVNLASGIPEFVLGGSELHSTRWVVDSGGTIVAHEEYDHRSGDWRLYADPMDHVLLAEAPDPTRNFDVLGLGRTDGAVLVNRPFGPDNDFMVVEYSTQADTAPQTPFGDAGVKALLTDPASGRLIGGVTNSDVPKTVLFSPDLQAKFDKLPRVFPGEVVALESATPDLSRMIILTEGPGDSGTYFYADMAAGKVEAIGWRYPTILQADVAATSIVRYKAADGLDIEGVLTLPPGRDPKRLPLVVLPHGGPQARDYQHFDWWAQAFASRGYAVLQPNFRGSSNFGKAFRDAGFGQWGRKMQTDVSDGVAALVKQGIVDPKRACVVGASYGGYVALAGVTVQQGIYRCAVSVGGIGDLNDLLRWDADRYGVESAALRYEHQFLGVTNNGDTSVRDLSPRHLAARADAPILLIFGKDDTVVSIDQSRGMEEALRAAGKPVEVLQLKDEDHWLSRAATRTQMLETAVAFVEKNNPPQ